MAFSPLVPRRSLTQRWARTARHYSLPYALVAPAFLFMLAVHLVPMAQGIYMSFLQLNQRTLKQFMGAPFVGLDNYRTLLFDAGNPVRAGLGFAVRNTLIYTAAVTAGVMVFGLAVALLLNRQFRGRGLARTLLLLPWVVPSYVVGVLWGFMWQHESGVINRLLVDGLGILAEKPFWLIGPNAIWAITIPTIWRSWPFVMVVLLSGLQTVDDEWYEAAAIDGANGWQKLWHVTLPVLRPIIAVQLLFQLLWNVYSYNIVATMYGNGAGYPGEWGDLMMTAITRQSFQMWQFGMGAAAAVMLMVLMLGVVWIWYRVYREELTVK